MSKTVLITGASRGVGKALAIKFVEEGFQVVTIARNADALENLKKECTDKPGALFTVNKSISDFKLGDLPDDVDEINILIHNAGKLVAKPFLEINREDLDAVYETNVFAPFMMTQKLFPHLAPNAHVITISSVGGVTGSVKFPGLTAYSSSKGAISILTEVLQAEFAETDLVFNSLALGSVQTEMLEEAFPGLEAAATPYQMADYVYHFAVNAPTVLKGKTISVSSSNP